MFDYEGLVIRCFDKSNTRGIGVAKKHLKGINEQQLRLHQYLEHLGDKYVAHPECK